MSRWNLENHNCRMHSAHKTAQLWHASPWSPRRAPLERNFRNADLMQRITKCSFNASYHPKNACKSGNQELMPSRNSIGLEIVP